MQNHEDLIHTFYRAFAKGNVDEMLQCYHDSIRFEDPAFGVLHGNEARNMWRMLVRPGIKITYHNVEVKDGKGSADWIAEYQFGEARRKVKNKIHAEFEFADGKISRHTDSFNLAKWARQALGSTGWALGWTTWFQNKIRAATRARLASFGKQPNG